MDGRTDVYGERNLVSHGDAGNDVGSEIDEENGDGSERKRKADENSDDERNHFRDIRRQHVGDRLLYVVENDSPLLQKKGHHRRHHHHQYAS